MKATVILVWAGFLILTLPACGSPRSTASGAYNESPSSAQSEAAASNAPFSMTQLNARQRAVNETQASVERRLPPGTRIYRIPMITVIAVRGTQRLILQFPAASSVVRTPNSIILTPPNAPAQTFSRDSQITYSDEGTSYYVYPGQRTPAFLRNLTPTMVVK